MAYLAKDDSIASDLAAPESTTLQTDKTAKGAAAPTEDVTRHVQCVEERSLCGTNPKGSDDSEMRRPIKPGGGGANRIGGSSSSQERKLPAGDEEKPAPLLNQSDLQTVIEELTDVEINAKWREIGRQWNMKEDDLAVISRDRNKTSHACLCEMVEMRLRIDDPEDASWENLIEAVRPIKQSVANGLQEKAYEKIVLPELQKLELELDTDEVEDAVKVDDPDEVEDSKKPPSQTSDAGGKKETAAGSSEGNIDKDGSNLPQNNESNHPQEEVAVREKGTGSKENKKVKCYLLGSFGHLTNPNKRKWNALWKRRPYANYLQNGVRDLQIIQDRIQVDRKRKEIFKVHSDCQDYLENGIRPQLGNKENVKNDIVKLFALCVEDECGALIWFAGHSKTESGQSNMESGHSNMESGHSNMGSEYSYTYEGSWLLHDGSSVTIVDIHDLYSKSFARRPLYIVVDCCYAGCWVHNWAKVLDMNSIPPCGHLNKRFPLKVIASCRSHQMAGDGVFVDQGMKIQNTIAFRQTETFSYDSNDNKRHHQHSLCVDFTAKNSLCTGSTALDCVFNTSGAGNNETWVSMVKRIAMEKVESSIWIE